MQIIISSYNSNIQVSKKELRQMVMFYYNCLFHKVKTKRKVSRIVLSFDDSNFDLKNHIAFCYGLTKRGKKKPTDFIIELNNRLTRAAIIKAVAHEMVHVRQFFLGDLTLDKRGQFIWKKTNGTFDDYFEFPWEIEAFGYEVGLVTKYRLFCKEIGFNVRQSKRSRPITAGISSNDSMAAAYRSCAIHKM